MKRELSEKEKDLLVLNNYSTSRFSLLHGLEEDAMQEDLRDHILVSCDVSSLQIVVCDLMDLYTDSRYVNAHKLKVLHDTNMTLILSFPLLRENEVITETIHVSATLQVSHINVTLDYLALERICGLIHALSAQSKLDYEKDVVRQLNDVSTAGFFSTSTLSLNSSQPDYNNNLVSIFNSYLQKDDEKESSSPEGVLSESSQRASFSSSSSARRSSSDFHSIASEDDTDFHSVCDSHSVLSDDTDDFKSVHDDASSVSHRLDWLSDAGSLQSSFRTRSYMRRNSVFSVSSSKHSSRRSRVNDRFVSIGGDEGGEDFKSVDSLSAGNTDSVDSTAKKRMNLNVAAACGGDG